MSKYPTLNRNNNGRILKAHLSWTRKKSNSTTRVMQRNFVCIHIFLFCT